MGWTTKEERALRLLERMTEEGSVRFLIVPFCARFYGREERPENWRGSMIKCLEMLSMKLLRYQPNAYLRKTSGRGRGAEATYEFKVPKDFCDV